jgi:hypothetical protein
VPGTRTRPAKRLEGNGHVYLFQYVNLGFAAGLFLAMVLLQEVGFRIGRAVRASEVSRAGAGLLEAAVFALLGLLLAFQFAEAGSRLDYQRRLVVEEANAIGTAYLRLNLLAPDRQPALRDLFRRYTDARIRIGEKMPDVEAVEAEAATARKLQTEIWSGTVAGSSHASSIVPALLLLPAVNEMIDVTTRYDVAARTHVPIPIFLLLFSVALLSALFSGFAISVANRRDWLHSLIFAAVVAITMFVILDLEYPHVGLIRVGAADQALVQARRAMD